MLKIDECDNYKFAKHLKEIAKLIKALKINYIKSRKNDRLLSMALRMENEAQRKKRQIMDMAQMRSETNLGPTVSTVSLVHLQYKYEELLINHRGLLSLLDQRNNEAKKVVKENDELIGKLQKLSCELDAARAKIVCLQHKIAEMKQRKNTKIAKLKTERRTLNLVHGRLAALLHRQCMEKNDFIESVLKTTPRSEKGLLLQEIRKNNMLNYENFQLRQQLEYLKAISYRETD